MLPYHSGRSVLNGALALAFGGVIGYQASKEVAEIRRGLHVIY